MKNGKERLEATKENLKQLILEDFRTRIEFGEKSGSPSEKDGDILVDLQTLITPPLNADDRRMDKDRTLAIKALRKEFAEHGFKQFLEKNGVKSAIGAPTITLVTSNHPVNIVRTIASIFINPFTERYQENQQVLKTVRKKAEKTSSEHNKTMALKALDKISKMSGFAKMRNLFVKGINHNAERAALEQIAVSAVGGTRIGSCMSGKDREGAVGEHVAAMTAFYGKYGEFPPIPDRPVFMLSQKDRDLREEYEKMVAKEFLAGHDQQIAEANAAGCSGLKGAKDILGANIMKQAKMELEKSKIGSAPDKITNKIANLNRIKASRIKQVKSSDKMYKQLQFVDSVAVSEKPELSSRQAVLFSAQEPTVSEPVKEPNSSVLAQLEKEGGPNRSPPRPSD